MMKLFWSTDEERLENQPKKQKEELANRADRAQKQQKEF